MAGRALLVAIDRMVPRSPSTPRSPRLHLVALAALVLAACGSSDDDDAAAAASSCIKLADGACVTETYHDPPLLKPNAQGTYELTLKPTEFTFNGQRHCGRAYNGQYPAPTIDTRASTGGEKRQVRVDLKNAFTKSDVRSLGADPCTCTDSVTKSSCQPHGGHTAGDTCVCTTAEGAKCHMFDFNTTNLHAHGSHVRPDFAAGGGCAEHDGLRCRACNGDGSGAQTCFHSDDVLTRVAPGEGVQHRWDIDEDGTHHAGLQWYHPHIHGSTAIQVASGATGAWIVRGALDEIPGIKNAKERVMLLTTPPIGYTPLKDGETCDENHITFNTFSVLGETSEKQTNLVNGLRRPRIVMPPGQIERWRILHGAFLDEVFFALVPGKDSDCKELDTSKPPIRLTQIGRDGLPLTKPASGADWPYAPEYVFMSPGYRIEALLDGSALKHGDNLCLVASRFLQEDSTGKTKEAVGLTKIPTPDELKASLVNADVIAIVNVTSAAGTPTETKMPDLSVVAAEAPSLMLQGGTLDANAKCAEAVAKKKIEDIDQFSALWMVFYNSETTDSCGFSDHNINAKNFENTDRKRYPYDRVLKKGAVDHWRVIAGFDGHPFHIHINPFLVCPLPPEGSSEPNAKTRIFEPAFAHWRDTYLLNLDRSMDMLTEYKSYAGGYVNHCHKLTHEDHGMMELIKVCDPAVEDCDKLCSGGPCTWKTCASDDDVCKRQLVATECLFDPTRCPEAKVRCSKCDKGCPTGSKCRSEADEDGVTRCAPSSGCSAPSDCPLTQTCDAGACVAAMCATPCPPPQMCAHGVCQ